MINKVIGMIVLGIALFCGGMICAQFGGKTDKDIWAGYWGTRMELLKMASGGQAGSGLWKICNENRMYWNELRSRGLIIGVTPQSNNISDRLRFNDVMRDCIKYDPGESLIGGQKGSGVEYVDLMTYEALPIDIKGARM